jgi:hypothetical protein
MPKGHYRVHVTYAPFPSMDRLLAEWGEGNVAEIFDGRPFKLHHLCEGADFAPGERIFYLHDPGHLWNQGEQIVWGENQRSAIAPNGYRPATHVETREFSQVVWHVDSYIGLGASAERGDGARCVTRIWHHDLCGQILGLEVSPVSFSRNRILFVAI